MKRREFITLLGGAAAAWPLAARAQQASGCRRIGVFLGSQWAADTDMRARSRAFQQGLAAIGLDQGPTTCAIEYRWGEGQCRSACRKHAAESGPRSR